MFCSMCKNNRINKYIIKCPEIYIYIYIENMKCKNKFSLVKNEKFGTKEGQLFTVLYEINSYKVI